MGCGPGIFEWRKDMKTLKCLMVVFMLLLSITSGTAMADTEHGYTRMFVFGASLGLADDEIAAEALEYMNEETPD